MTMIRGTLLAYLTGLIFLQLALTAVAREDHHATEREQTHKPAASALRPSTNPLIEEMHVLDSVFREVVSAVSLGDGARVEGALHAMHGAMEKTHEGVHHGTVTLSKNADKLEMFFRMDKDFHGELDRLALAGRKNDQQAMLAITKDLLDRCVTCHTMFR